MSQIRTISLRLWLAALFALVLAGCGDKNTQTTFSSDGKHLAGWMPVGHKAAAMKDVTACTECHGSDYSGGIAKVACTSCHMGNQLAIHPLEWNGQTVANHAAYVTASGTARCATTYCHGTDLAGVASSGPSCTSCHIGGALAVHPWPAASYMKDHGAYVVDKKSTASCQNAACHGTDLKGIDKSGVSCTKCHTSAKYLTYMK